MPQLDDKFTADKNDTIETVHCKLDGSNSLYTCSDLNALFPLPQNNGVAFGDGKSLALTSIHRSLCKCSTSCNCNVAITKVKQGHTFMYVFDSYPAVWRASS